MQNCQANLPVDSLLRCTIPSEIDDDVNVEPPAGHGNNEKCPVEDDSSGSNIAALAVIATGWANQLLACQDMVNAQVKLYRDTSSLFDGVVCNSKPPPEPANSLFSSDADTPGIDIIP